MSPDPECRPFIGGFGGFESVRGQATLKRGHSDRPLWRTTIRMPFLGAASINPHGPDLSVDLDPGYDFFDPGPDFFD